MEATRNIDSLTGKLFANAFGAVYAAFLKVVHKVCAIKGRCWGEGDDW
jgi:hypothetical protein